jgi:hypothetical protein
VSCSALSRRRQNLAGSVYTLGQDTRLERLNLHAIACIRGGDITRREYPPASELLALWSIICGSSLAADTLKGYEAYNAAGIYKSALEEFRTSAQAGDALAMFYLVESCYNGRGVCRISRTISWKAQALARNWVPGK